MASIYRVSNKIKTATALLTLKKTHCLKVVGILLCLLMFSPILITIATAPVAATYIGGAAIWGAESTGSINNNLNPPESWRKTNGEVDRQRSTAAYIDSLFDSNGYFSTNNQGSNGYSSEKDDILDQIGYLETNYPRVVC